MKRLLYDFASKQLSEIKPEIEEKDIYSHMIQNKYRFMYVYFND